MLLWSLIPLIIALVAALFSFRHEPSTLTYISKLIFYTGVCLFVTLLITYIVQSGAPAEHGQMPAAKNGMLHRMALLIELFTPSKS